MSGVNGNYTDGEYFVFDMEMPEMGSIGSSRPQIGALSDSNIEERVNEAARMATNKISQIKLYEYHAVEAFYNGYEVIVILNYPHSIEDHLLSFTIGEVELTEADSTVGQLY